MKIKKTAQLGFMVSVAVALQIFEAMIPVPVPVPGGKFGFANIVTFIVLLTDGGKSAVLVAFIRALLGSLLYGGFVHGIYSVTAAVGSAIVSVVLYKYSNKFSIVGISVSAALVHNFLQVAVAFVIFSNLAVFTYYPVLMLISIPCGMLTGFVTGYIKNIIK